MSDDPRHSGTNNNASGRTSPRKEGVASPEELKEFVEAAGEGLLVVDLRNPNVEQEPGDAKSLAVAGLPGEGYRPRAVHLKWDRDRSSMPLPDAGIPKDTPIITHCGGGGRGQLAKEFLEEHGFTNVLNGGGPKEKECWETFGHL
jgi:rhodanese-related sulfurtransferase